MDGDDSEPVEPLAHEDEGQQIDLLRDNSTVREMLSTLGVEYSTKLANVIHMALQVEADPRRHHGIDTVLVVDTSASIKGKIEDQLKSTLIGIVTTMEDVAVNHYLEENVALVVFGNENKILHHLTTDYDTIIESLDCLEFGGSSPILAGLLLASMIINDHGGPTCVSWYCIPPRIVLFSDGRGTDDVNLDDDTLEFKPKDQMISHRIESLAEQIGKDGTQIYTVGIGQQVNFTLLEKIATVSGGKYFKMDNTSYLANHFKYQFIAGKTIKVCKEEDKELLYGDVLESENRKHQYELDVDEMELICKLIVLSEELTDVEHFQDYKLGSRVALQDHLNNGEKLYGTVERQRKDGILKVMMDCEEVRFLNIKDESFNKHTCVICSRPRRLSQFDTILPGAWVIRASETTLFEVGSVFEVTESGYIKVRWHGETCKVERFRLPLEPDLCLHSASFPTSVKWCYKDGDSRGTFSLEESELIQNLFSTKGNRQTRPMTLLGENVRITFKDKKVHCLESGRRLQLIKEDVS